MTKMRVDSTWQKGLPLLAVVVSSRIGAAVSALAVLHLDVFKMVFPVLMGKGNTWSASMILHVMICKVMYDYETTT
jgi:hypothetical protein